MNSKKQPEARYAPSAKCNMGHPLACAPLGTSDDPTPHFFALKSFFLVKVGIAYVGQVTCERYRKKERFKKRTHDKYENACAVGVRVLRDVDMMIPMTPKDLITWATDVVDGAKGKAQSVASRNFFIASALA